MGAHMRFGLNLANFGYLGNVRTQLELALAAEAAGWDGFFLWDHVNFPGMGVHADPWITLGVIASQTDRLILGTAVTPVARRRPVKLAREILTLDALSSGRFVFGAGNGIFPDEFEKLGDEGDLRVRAQKLEEGLELMQALWTDEDVAFAGRHYAVDTRGFGRPYAGRRIPIWIGATWPRRKPVARAASYDGIIPILDPFTEHISPKQVRELRSFIAELRDSDEAFDIVIPQMGGTGDVDADGARMQEFADAGATWVLDAGFPGSEPLEDLIARVRRGPPRIDS
jgi:alkanesulfonate monooxygenase SsuD/methylene tetrahydromethanopterin reductase-like flavin-dependent oxidoreductase (luciferase family)